MLAGTFIAGVVYAGTVVAANILAGTMSAVNVSGGTYALTSAPNTMAIDGTNGFRQRNTTTDNVVDIFNGNITLNANVSDERIKLEMPNNAGGVIVVNNDNNNVAVEIQGDDVNLGQADSGYIRVANSSGTSKVELGIDSSGNGRIDIDGTQVIAPQQATVALITETADGTYDTTEQDMLNNLKTTVNNIRTRLRAHGLIA